MDMTQTTTTTTTYEDGAQAPFINDILKITETLLSKNLKTIGNETLRHMTFCRLKEIVGDHDFYLINDVETVKEIWSQIESDGYKVQLVELVLRITAELKLRLKYTDDDFSHLIDLLSSSYGYYSKPSVKQDSKDQLPAEVFKRLPRARTVEELLKANHWLVILYLLSNLDLRYGDIDPD